MSMELCKLCNQDSTPWFHINGHICEDCYYRDKWISVKDRFPEKVDQYIIFKNKQKPIVTIEWYCAFNIYSGKKEDKELKFIYSNYFEDKNVTHWMPLPEPPK